MTIRTHTLGFPRVGLRRELKKRKKALGRATPPRRTAGGRARAACPPLGSAKTAGVDLLPVGDFPGTIMF
ncbi:hypothetical protein ACNKHO_24480 [Shigella flexneri]